MSDNLVLVTGATGYVGSRLLRALEAGGCRVRCMARNPRQVHTTLPGTEVVQGDCLDEASLGRALAGVRSAYYLVHSMQAGPQFAEMDHRAALTFGRAAARAGVSRIIYLGGLADDIHSHSPHLKSRAQTGEALRAAGVPVVEFRASIVIGAGSLPFEMIRGLVERLPVMICPRWVDTPTQPIAIDDLIGYLEGALSLPEGGNRVFEIGGPHVVSYGDVMREYARLRGLRRLLIPVPVLTPHLSGMWLTLVTPAQARIGRALVEGLRDATVVRNAGASQVFRIPATPLVEALRRAIAERATPHRKMDIRSVIVNAPPADAFAPVRRIGGAAGWYYADPLWRLRGVLDRWCGGVGMSRGRRDPDSCVAGDVIDGWTVEACEPDRLLRLAGNLMLPGKGWLEFTVTPLDGATRSEVRLTATFDPRGLSGRAYWYGIYPFHALIFRGLLRQVARRAEHATRRSPVESPCPDECS